MNADGTRCGWFNGHRWTKWEDVTAFQKVSTAEDKAVLGQFIVQHRRCEKCGKLQARRVEQ